MFHCNVSAAARLPCDSSVLSCANSVLRACVSPPCDCDLRAPDLLAATSSILDTVDVQPGVFRGHTPRQEKTRVDYAVTHLRHFRWKNNPRKSTIRSGGFPDSPKSSSRVGSLLRSCGRVACTHIPVVCRVALSPAAVVGRLYNSCVCALFVAPHHLILVAASRSSPTGCAFAPLRIVSRLMPSYACGASCVVGGLC